MNLTVPAMSFFIEAKTSAVPIKIAIWLSWPQACITGTFCPRYSAESLEAKATFTLSYTGRASISARSAITGPGLPPLRIATTPASLYPSPRGIEEFSGSRVARPLQSLAGQPDRENGGRRVFRRRHFTQGQQRFLSYGRIGVAQRFGRQDSRCTFRGAR